MNISQKNYIQKLADLLPTIAEITQTQNVNQSKIDSLVEKILHKDNQLITAQNTLNLAEKLHLLDEKNSVNISKRLASHAENFTDSPIFQLINQKGWQTHWKNYREIVCLIPTENQSENLLHSINQTLSKEISLEKIMKLIHPFFNKEDSEDIVRIKLILHFFVSFSEEMKDPIIEFTREMIDNGIKLERIVKILRFFFKVPVVEQKIIIKHSKALFHHESMNTQAKLDMLEFVEDHYEKIESDIENWNHILQCTREFFNAKMNVPFKDQTTSCRAFLSLLFSVTLQDRQEAIQQARQLFTETIDKGEFHVIYALLVIQKIDRENVILLAKTLFKPSLSCESRGFILKGIGIVYTKNCWLLVEDCRCLMENLTGKEICNLLQITNSFNQDDRKSIIEYSQKLFNKTMDGEGKIEILKAIKSVPLSKRQYAIESVKDFFQENFENTSGNEMSHIIWAFNSIPSMNRNDRLRIINLANDILSKDTSVFLKGGIIQAIGIIPLENLPEILVCTKKLLNGLSIEPSAIIKELSNIPKINLNEIVERTQLLICGMKTSYDIVSIITTISQIKVDLNDVISYVVKYFNDSIGGYDKSETIKEIKNIPKDERENVINYTIQLCSNSTNFPIQHSEKRSILITMNKIHQSARQDILIRIQKLQKLGLNIHISSIMNELNAIREDEREDVITHMLWLIDGKKLYELTGLIPAISKVPISRRNAVLTLAKNINIEYFSNSTNNNLVSILQALTDINEVENLIECAKKLLKNLLSTTTKIEILKEIGKIPSDDRFEIIMFMEMLLKKHSNISIAENLAPLHRIPKEDRLEVIDLTLKLVNRTEPCFSINRIFSTIQQIPKSKRNYILELSYKFIVKFGYLHKSNIIAVIANITNDVKHALMHAEKLIEENSTYETVFGIIKQLGNTPIDDRLDLVSRIQALSYGKNFDKVAVLTVLRGIPSEDRDDVTSHTIAFISDKKNFEEISDILEAVKDIPQAKRSHILALAKRVSRGNNNENAKIIKVLSNIKKDAEDVVKYAEKYFITIERCTNSTTSQFLVETGLLDPEERQDIALRFIQLATMGNIGEPKNIFAAIRNTPADDRDDVISHAVELLKEVRSFINLNWLIIAIRNIPKQLRQQILTQANKIITGMDLSGIVKIINILSKVTDNVENVFMYAEYLFPEMLNNETKISLLEQIAVIPMDDRKNIITAAKRLCETINSEFVYVLASLNVIPEECRIPLIEKYKTLNCFVEYLDSKLRNNHKFRISHSLFMLYLLPEELRQIDRLNACMHPIQEDPSYMPALVSSLNDKLYHADLPMHMKLFIADFIYKNTIALKLHEDHPLTQEAIGLKILNAIEGDKNPFTFFKKLEALAAKSSNFCPPKLEVRGDSFPLGINIKQLQGMSTEIKRIDLPQHASLEVFKELIKTLKIKIKSSTNQKLADEALRKLTASWSEVHDASLFLEGVMEYTPVEYVTDREAQWRAVLSCILSIDATEKENQFFTDREEALICNMMSIQSCPAGKIYGIATLYQNLASAYRYKQSMHFPVSPSEAFFLLTIENSLVKVRACVEKLIKKVSEESLVGELLLKMNRKMSKYSAIITPLLQDYIYWTNEDCKEITLIGAQELIDRIYQDDAKEPLFGFVSSAVLKFLEAQFTEGNALLRELVGLKEGEEISPQAAHQVLYLKNLIGHHIGIRQKQKPIFDRYIGNIPESLIQKDLNEVLAIFFKYVTPQSLIQELVRTAQLYPEEYKSLFKTFLGVEKLDEKGALKLLIITRFLQR